MYDLLKKRIEEARKKDGRSANAVSIAAGVNRSYIGKIGTLKGKKVPEPSVLTIKAIAKQLRVPTAWLVDAIDADEAEEARGISWPPSGKIDTAPKLNEFVEDRDELALLAFWRSLKTDENRRMALAALKGMALENKGERRGT